jgi:hypothetical protein
MIHSLIDDKERVFVQMYYDEQYRDGTRVIPFKELQEYKILRISKSIGYKAWSLIMIPALTAVMVGMAKKILGNPDAPIQDMTKGGIVSPIIRNEIGRPLHPEWWKDPEDIIPFNKLNDMIRKHACFTGL